MLARSRPPLLSELTPSTSGIVQDPQTGDRKVAPSKRPDGTLRREIRIRPGFTPPEDVSKYKSSKQAEFENRRLPKGSVIGFIRPEVKVAQSVMKSMSDAQKKNVKRKEKRKAAGPKVNDGYLEEEKEEVPNDWGKDGADSEDGQSQDKSLTYDCSESGHGFNLFKSAIKSSSSNPPIHPLQQLVPPPTEKPFPTPFNQAPKESNPRANVKLFDSALQSLEPVGSQQESVEKRARSLKKRLNQAEQLKARKVEGEILLPEQLEKISKIDEIQSELIGLSL